MTDDELLGEYLGWLRTVSSKLIAIWPKYAIDQQDLIQEGYIAMWKAIRSHKPGSAPLDYWMKFQAHHRMKTVCLRSHSEQPEEIPEWFDIAAPDLLERVELAYHHGEIAQAIGSLTPQQKKYVYARFWLGLSGNEMRELGVFNYDPSALWNSKRNGARWKLEKELAHLR